MTILDTILAHKHTEVEDRRSRKPLAELQACAADQPPPRGFTAALQTAKVGSVALIAEVKKASPSAGLIRPDFDPVQIACTYAKSGAACLSILTDERFFSGHDDFLQAVRKAVSLPLLRKDFIVDAYQVSEARALGADAVLLIAAALTPAQIADYGALAQELGMAALVEVHTEEEMQFALAAQATLIGINSRDLKTFVTDLDTVERLAALVPAGVTLVAESGLKTHADVERVARAGAKAILVGETLMRAPDIGLAVTELLGGT
jgi:indole-3-glycerol phosphate synthase